ncbi:hypothetical protein ACEZCY_12855 [Streptacidiphilus sp. N1-12]|uniref:Lipoprotein n=2 Tax=Streptacidiphilus alkalitolerans TaxID=3342712 RepID=A0ABV6WDM6_9ACTN
MRPAHRAAVALLILSTAGCSAAVASQPLGSIGAPPAATSAAAGSAASGFDLPIDAYQLSEPQRTAQLRATNLLLTSCMARFGYSLPVPAADQAAQVPENAFRYGPVTADQASDGYLWMVDHGSTDLAEAQLSQAEQAMPGAETAVLTGRGPARVSGKPVPAGGCVGEMKRRITAGGGTYGDAGLVQEIDQASYTDSLTSPRVVAVFRAWSSCMAAQGYRYPTPLDPMKDNSLFTAPTAPATHTSTPGATQPRGGSSDAAPRTAPSARQVAVARADVACKSRTNLVAVWSSVESALQQQDIRKHAQDFATLGRQLQTTVRNINAVLH